MKIALASPEIPGSIKEGLQQLATLAKDAAAGAEFLSTRNDIDKNKIGLYGISQGGWVAP